MSSIKPAAVAGMFYPNDPKQLSDAIDHFIGKIQLTADAPIPKAIIAPHAGFIYSGEIAGTAYACLSKVADQITRVIIIGPAHRHAVHGVAVSSAKYFATPLGDIPVDTACVKQVLSLPQVSVVDAAFTEEHCLEVQLPFLQKLLRKFTIVPLLVGNTEATVVAAVLNALWGDEHTLVVISSDLSHFHDYRTAQKLDQATALAIETANMDKIGYESACGRRAINGLLALSKDKNLQIKTLDVRNSGDTGGANNKNRVVGYGAFHVFTGVK